MVYTTTYINQVISNLYSCIGTLGDKIDLALRYGTQTDCERKKIKKAFLYALALNYWTQSDDGLTIGTNNITVAQRDMIIDDSFKICGCLSPSQTINNQPGTEHYWEAGYSDPAYNV